MGVRSAAVFLLVFSLFVAGVDAQGQGDATQVLLRVKQAVMESVQGLPRYVCTETMDRTRYEPDAAASRMRSCDDLAAAVKQGTWKLRLSSSDRLRLDVAVGRVKPGLDSEMYSWAGEGRFSDSDLFEMVHDGAVSTGSFSSILASVFGGEAASFSYNGNKDIDGRSLAEFGFRVPLERSSYSYVLGTGAGKQVTIGYDGTFVADPATLDLVRLVLRASHLPEESGACEITQTLTYGRVRLHGAEFLLPKEVRILALHADGSEAQNLVHYSGCREFEGESKVRFEPPAKIEQAGYAERGEPAGLVLPAGLAFKLAFTERIDPAVAAAGDLIRAKLKTAIRDRSAKVWVPEGAAVTGRILNIRRFYGPSQTGKGLRASMVLKVKLESVDVGGAPVALKARREVRAAPFTASGGLSPRVELGTLGTAADSADGAFEFWDAKPNTKGLVSDWVTIP